MKALPDTLESLIAPLTTPILAQLFAIQRSSTRLSVLKSITTYMSISDDTLEDIPVQVTELELVLKFASDRIAPASFALFKLPTTSNRGPFTTVSSLMKAEVSIALINALPFEACALSLGGWLLHHKSLTYQLPSFSHFSIVLGKIPR